MFFLVIESSEEVVTHLEYNKGSLSGGTYLVIRGKGKEFDLNADFFNLFINLDR